MKLFFSIFGFCFYTMCVGGCITFATYLSGELLHTRLRLGAKYSSVRTNVALQLSSNRYSELPHRPGFWDLILVSPEMSLLQLNTVSKHACRK